MKKSLLALIGILFSTSLFSQKLILLKTFKINGIEEEKKVKIIGKEEYTYSGKPKIISQNGKVKEIFFYDEKGNLIQKETEQGIYKYEYNSNNQIIYTDCYGKIEFYFEYDDKGREIYCKELDDNNIYEYFYAYDDEKRTWSLEEQKSVMGMLFMI